MTMVNVLRLWLNYYTYGEHYTYGYYDIHEVFNIYLSMTMYVDYQSMRRLIGKSSELNTLCQ